MTTFMNRPDKFIFFLFRKKSTPLSALPLFFLVAIMVVETHISSTFAITVYYAKHFNVLSQETKAQRAKSHAPVYAVMHSMSRASFWT